jgi:hypothetical protein
MGNNSTNIFKANNHLSPRITEHNEMPPHMPMEIKIQTWDGHTIGLYKNQMLIFYNRR